MAESANEIREALLQRDAEAKAKHAALVARQTHPTRVSPREHRQRLKDATDERMLRLSGADLAAQQRQQDREAQLRAEGAQQERERAEAERRQQATNEEVNKNGNEEEL
ncbi:hypothetical protein ACRAWB_18260 [Leifsonia poae]|uniref:hypothetical protein n=1 Tax=Leifsonia poae TaxID=110933 RepID=UPI003D6953A2